MPNEIKQCPGSASHISKVFKNVVRDLNQKIFVVRPFRVVHEAKASHYKYVETKGDKRSMVDVGKNLNHDCQVLLYRCGEVFPCHSKTFPLVIARHEVPKQSQTNLFGQNERKRSVISRQQSGGWMGGSECC